MNAVWNALADPTRRAILDLLRERPRTSGDLASHFPTTRFATRKHLKALEAAGLVLVRREGRERWNYLNAAPLQMIYERWVTPYQAIWAERATKLKVKLEKGNAMTPSRTATIARVELEILIKAPAADVWRALLEDTTLWWPREFYTGAAKGFHIEPRLGGRVYEDWGNGNGVVWYQVFGLNPGISLDLQGSMAVPYGPALTLLHLELAAAKAGTTLKISDTTIGAAGHEGEAEKAKGWEQIFGEGLKRHVELRMRTRA
jgi:DNA-binding transcriptional ArsR family regulator